MKTRLAPLMLLLAMACVNSREARRFSRHVPPAEAAWFKIEFNQELPEQGQKNIPGAIVAAIQVAMDDFLPWREPAPARITTDLDFVQNRPGRRQGRLGCYHAGSRGLQAGSALNG